MGKLLLIAALCIMHVCAFSSPLQEGPKISLKAKNITYKTLFDSIYAKTKYSVFYANKLINLQEKVSVNFSNVSLREMMESVLKNKNIDCDISNDGYVRLTARSASTSAVTSESKSPDVNVAPPITIAGKVSDTKGNRLAGATVMVKGTSNGTATDMNGIFKLDNVPSGATLLVSFTGYSLQEIGIGSRSNIDIVLNESISDLDETVIIAYGTSTKRQLTSNISRITAEDIGKQPVSNPLQALQGRVAGLTVQQASGLPGGRINVQIRGRNSIAQGNDPFYVIDGVPYTSTSFTSSSIIPVGSPLNYINPSDIESIEILKDADALAIYGSRGANGAILITTKKGKAGKSKVDINVYQGMGRNPRKLTLLTTPQYLQMRNEAFRNDGVSKTTSNARDLLLWDTTMYTDWQKELLGGTASYTSAQASISGGTDQTQFLFGGGYFRETTVFPGEFSDQKGSLHFNINHTSNNGKFKALLTTNYLQDFNTLLSSDLTLTALTLSPNAPKLYNSNATLNWENGTWTNPISTIKRTYKGQTGNAIINSALSYTLAKGLQLKSNLGYTDINVKENSLSPISALNPFESVTTGQSYFSNTRIKTWIVEPQLEYTIKISKGVIGALLGSTIQQSLREQQGILASGYTNDKQLSDIKAATSYLIQNSIYTQYRYQACFGRLNYNWDGKYILNLTARRDGSSRFGPGKQFAGFAAIGGAWIFSNEPFVKRAISFLSFGKLRASYGTTGNDQIEDYGFLDLWTPRTYTYLGVKGNSTSKLFNSNYAWEVNKKFEIAAEIGLLNDKLLVKASYYRNRSGNQLVGYPLSTVSGFDNIIANLPAVVQNDGLEFEIVNVNLTKGNFIWTTSLNATVPKNKLVSYPNFNSSSYTSLYAIGEPLTIRKLFNYQQVNSSTGVYEYLNANGQLTSNPSTATDRNVLENIAPAYYGGIANTISWKGFNLDFLFQFVKQTGVNSNYTAFNYTPGKVGNQPEYVMNRWTKGDDQSDIQKFSQQSGAANTAYTRKLTSTSTVSDASFIRLKNISFSYLLPASLCNKMNIKNAKVYLQSQNLMTFTSYKGLDPETQNTSLPPLRVLTAGFNVTL